MRYFFCTLLVLVVFSALASVSADDAAGHKKLMQTAQDFMVDLSDALDANESLRAAKAASGLAETCRRERAYWEKKGLADAVKLSRQTLAQSEQISAAIQSKQIGEAQRIYLNLNNTCRACHDAHPERRVPHDGR